MTTAQPSTRDSRRRLVSVGVYGATSAMPRLVNAVLAIFYTSLFSPQAYGAYGILSVLTLMISTLLDLGMAQAVMRDYYEHQHDWLKAKRFLADLVVSAELVALAVFPLLGLALYIGWQALGLQSHHPRIYVLLLLSIGMADRGGLLVSSLLRATERPFNYALGPICDAVVSLACGIGFVTILHWGVPGAMAGMLAGRLCSRVIYQVMFRYGLGITGGRPNWLLIRKCLGFGLPLVPTRVATWARESGLRPLLTTVVSMGAIGAYSFGSSLAALPTLAATAVDLALFPYYLKQRSIGAEGFEKRVRDFSLVFLALLLPPWAALILFSRELVSALTNEHYTRAGPVCAILLCASFIRMQTPFFARQIHFLRQTWIQLAVTVPAAALSIGLSLFLASRFGIEQASWGVAAAELVCFAAFVVLIRRYEPVHYPAKTSMLMSAFLLALAGLNAFYGKASGATLWSGMAERLAVIAAITLACAAFWIWPKRHFIAGLVRR